MPKQTSSETRGATRDLYVVFDGPPSHESGRFIELEDAEGRGVGGVAEWVDRGDGYWTLGPFAAAPNTVFTERERKALCLLACERTVDPSGAAWEEAELRAITKEEWQALHFKLKGDLTLSATLTPGSPSADRAVVRKQSIGASS